MLDPLQTSDTLEEGRVALDRLERQLRLRASNETPDAVSESSSSRLQASVSRKRLDQLPRVARLNNRDESLGLTVEELDDRGLLDGGGSVPSYYTSLKQKNRRTLELQPRSTRLQERGKEVVSKTLNAVFHMLRTYVRWGVAVEDSFIQSDPSRTGTMPKKTFLHVLKRIELPFRQKELSDVANQYADPSTDRVDYRTMLAHAHLESVPYQQQPLASPQSHTRRSGSSPGFLGTGLMHSDDRNNVLREVKRMILESIKALNKNFDDLYRMFARWDTDGSGTITATQFLRVLNRLHVDISDADQDFLVELLDTQGAGRIDFESLLTYCFISLSSPDNNHHHHNSNNNNNNNAEGTRYQQVQSPVSRQFADAEDDAGGETVSAMSVDGNTSLDMKSHTTPLSSHRRPWTAASARGLSNAPRSPVGSLLQSDLGADWRLPTLSQHDDLPSTPGHHSGGGAGGSGSGSGAQQRSGTRGKVRPVTALARVSSSQQSHSVPHAGSNNNNNGATGQEHVSRRNRPQSATEDELFLDLPDDVLHGEEMYLPVRNGGVDATAGAQGQQQQTGAVRAATMAMPGWTHSTAATDPYNIMAPPQHSRDHHQQQTRTIDDAFDAVRYPAAVATAAPVADDEDLGDLGDLGEDPRRVNSLTPPANSDREDAAAASPVDHLVLLATQTLSTLRDILLVRYRRGRSLVEIFQHFDRRGRGFFDLRDFMRAAADLRLEMSERVARLALNMMALDSVSYVTFGEFKVYLLDSEHAALVVQIQALCGQLYERFGHGFTQYLWGELQRDLAAPAPLPVDADAAATVAVVVPRDSVARVLKKIGLQLSAADMSRLLDRLDAFGHDECNIARLMQLLTQCDAWRQARRNLQFQDRAHEEAALVRRQKQAAIAAGVTAEELGPQFDVPDEVLDMCEYLGICVLTEENMVWIAVDALRAPLPVNWVVQQDSGGRNFFYNVLTQEARWEHPLDPHFRNLRDRYRQSGVERGEVATDHQPDNAAGGSASDAHHASSTNNKNKYSNSNAANSANVNSSSNGNDGGGRMLPDAMLGDKPKLLTSASSSGLKLLGSGQHTAKSAKKNDSANSNANNGAVPNPTFSYTGASAMQTAMPTIPRPVTVSQQSASRPISAPILLHRPWEASVKMNQKARVGAFMQEREAMVEAVYTAPFLPRPQSGVQRGKEGSSKQLSTVPSNAGTVGVAGAGASSGNQRRGNPLTQSKEQRLKEMFDDNVLDRLGGNVYSANR